MWVKEENNPTQFNLVIAFDDDQTPPSKSRDYHLIFATNSEVKSEKARLLRELAVWQQRNIVDVSQRMKEFEERLNMLWNAPGGPGAVIAQAEFEKKVERSVGGVVE